MGKLKAPHTPRPLCAQCAKPYGERWTDRKDTLLSRGEEPAPYTGPDIVIKEDNQEWGTSQTMHHRVLWDGKRYITPYRPFCTLRCALVYARGAYMLRSGKKTA